MKKYYFKGGEGEGGGFDATAFVVGSVKDLKSDIAGAAKKADVEKAFADGKADTQKAIDAAVASIKEDLKKEVGEQLSPIQVKLDEADKQIKSIDEKAGRLIITPNNAQKKCFGDVFSESVAENISEIKKVGSAFKTRIELKDVGNMTVAANLTGSAVASYQTSPALVPAQKVNIRDLVPGVQSETGIYKLYRETGTEGSISIQSTPGVAKTQIDYDLTEATYTANYIAGYARIAKQMLQDLPFMQSALPAMLLRDFYKRENQVGFAAISGAATGSTTTSGSNEIEKLIDYVANLLDTDFAPTAITVNAALWASVLKTKPNDYSIPGGVTIDAVGNVRILGIPLIPASWMPTGKAIVGDWSMAKLVSVDGLSVQFYEQDADNVTKNLVTVKVEAREVFAIDRLDAFTYATVS